MCTCLHGQIQWAPQIAPGKHCAPARLYLKRSKHPSPHPRIPFSWQEIWLPSLLAVKPLALLPYPILGMGAVTLAAPSGRSSLSVFDFSASLTRHLFSLAGCKCTYSFWLLPLLSPPPLPVFPLMVAVLFNSAYFQC